VAVINVLDKHTAELIAAGEVVEKPASAVKELVENAIDAGAHLITVTIEAGGVRFIEVSDDGTGIEAAYIGKAFLRHATSKIAREEDLNHIHTLGFRGEALASIASVARVEVLTKTEPDEFACDYRIEGGEELGMEAGARGVGTTIRVRDLFYNTPARMKFLKKDASEGTFVAEVVGHAALSHPEISFRFVREGKLQYVTPGDGKLRSAAYAVLGREFSRDLIPVDDAAGNYRVTGLVTPPRSCRASRGMQLFYINGRYVKNRTIMAALESAFKGTTMQGKFPGAVLMLEMPPELVDVNVHPAKTEVRFARENEVFDAVYRAVRGALSQPGTGEQQFLLHTQDAGTGTDTNDESAEENDSVKQNDHTGLSAVTAHQSAPGQLPHAAARADADGDILEMPAAAQTAKTSGAALSGAERLSMRSPAAGGARRFENAAWADESGLDIRPEPAETEKAAPREAGAAGGNDAGAQEPAGAAPAQGGAVQEGPSAAADAPVQPEFSEQIGAQQTTFLEEPEQEPLQYVGELFRTYIVTQRGDEACLIDKHAAHERILYEQLAKNYGNVAGQLLLTPLTVDLTAEEKQAVLEQRALLLASGFEVDDFGSGTVAVRTVPADVEPGDAEDLIVEIADKLAKGSRDALSEKTEWVLHSIACRAAIKAGDRTSPQQLMALAQQILSGEVPPFCPHGRPCVLKLTRKELEKQFGRIV
jgi:DNA mismatch repair protein MutL